MARNAAERKVRALERDVYRAKARLEAARRKLPMKEVPEYVLAGHDGKPLRLSEAFGDKTDLVVVHNMGARCPMCTTWADGFNGLVPHIEDRCAFLVASPDPVRVGKAFHRKRGWRFRMASSAGTSFFRDMGYEDDEGRPWPGVSAFHKAADGKVYRTGTTGFGPGDDFCPLFALFPLLKDGQNDWWPKLAYARRKRATRRTAR
jgi:predicted dithiol-disulfide oxidoreductase (DUF899 family)